MEKNKKKKVINSVLAGVLTTSAVATTAGLLTSCNVNLSGSTSSDENKVEGSSPNELEEGFSSFITNSKQNDYEQLTDVKNFTIYPELSTINLPGATEQLKYAKDYVPKMKIFKDLVTEHKTRLISILKSFVINKVETAMGEGMSELKPFVNVTQKNGKCIIAYQLSYMFASEQPEIVPPEEVDPENPGEDIEIGDVARYARTLKTDNFDDIKQARPYIAFKYEFDLRDIKFFINNDSALVIDGLNWTGKMDFFGRIEELPDDLKIEEMNNQPKFFSTYFPHLFVGNPYEKIENWNKKIINQSLLNSLKNNYRNSVEQKINILKGRVNNAVAIIDELTNNDPTLRSFIFYLAPTITRIAESMGLNPVLVTTIKDVLNPNVQLGTAKNPQPGTLYYDLKELKEAGVINGTIENVLKRIIFPKLKNKHPVDYILELPNTLAGMNQDAINSILSLLKFIAKDLYNKIVTMGKKIDFVFQIFKNLMERAPTVDVNGKQEHRIGEIKVLDFISDQKMYGYWDYLINTLVPVLVKDPSKAASIINKKNKVKAILAKLPYDKSKLKDILHDLAYVNYERKVIGFISKWDREKSIGTFFNEDTSFSVEEQTINPNSDGQSFNVKLVYRLNFNKEVRIWMQRIAKICKKIPVGELLQALEITDKSLLIGFANLIGNLGKAFPKNIHIMPGDYIEYRIEDPRAFIIPTEKGYSIKAKQSFKPNFQKSLDRTYESLKDKYLMWWGQVKKIAGPIYRTLRNYYADSWYGASLFNGDINDQSNSFDLTQGVFDGNFIDNSESNLNYIKTNIITPFVTRKENLQNWNKEFSFELEGDIKNRILTQLGLDPSVFASRSKFILSSRPGFSIKVKQGSLPEMSKINLDVYLNTPVLQKDSVPPKWINEVKFSNL